MTDETESQLATTIEEGDLTPTKAQLAAMLDRTLSMHEALLAEARAAAAWRTDEFAPWKQKVDAKLSDLEKSDATITAEAVDAAKAVAMKAEQAAERAVLSARGSEETVLAELANVKGDLSKQAETAAKSIEALRLELDGARQLAGKLPAIESQIASAQTLLSTSSASIATAAATINNSAAASRRWRKLQPLAIGVVSAILISLSQRFALPPAAPNSQGTLLPGPMPTVNAAPAK